MVNSVVDLFGPKEKIIISDVAEVVVIDVVVVTEVVFAEAVVADV